MTALVHGGREVAEEKVVVLVEESLHLIRHLSEREEEGSGSGREETWPSLTP